MSQTIGALRKALDVIEMLAEDGQDIGVSELARRLGMTKNQVFRILQTLKAYDYVRQTRSGSYQLGCKFFEIGQRVVSRNGLLDVALPIMSELRDATGETVHLFVRDGLEALCVARRESPAAVSLSARVGRRFLLHAGACPKAILAYQDSALLDAVIANHGLPSYTPNTITDRRELERHLAEIRAAGYAESIGDLDGLGYSVAVPICNSDGEVYAAMSVAGPLHRFSDERRARALALVIEARDQISASLGAPVVRAQSLSAGE